MRYLKTNKTIVASAVAAFLSASAGAFAQDDGQQALNLAETQLKSGKIEESLAGVRKILSADPNNKPAHTLLGQIYMKAGANPNDVNYRLLTADTLYKQGRLKEAEVEYKASLCVKLTPRAYVGLGRIAERLQGKGEGRVEFERALEVDNNCAAAHAELGKYFLMTSDMVKANEELTKALSLDPSDKDAAQTMVKLWQEQVAAVPNVNSHLGLAKAYQSAGDLANAQAEYKEVVKLDPNHPSLPAARQSFKIAIAQSRAADEFTQAKTLATGGRLAEAYHYIADAVAYVPGNCDYKLLQGELLEKLAQPAEAKQVYMAILDIDPQNQQAIDRLKNLASMAAASGGQVMTPVMTPGAVPAQMQMQGQAMAQGQYAQQQNPNAANPDLGDMQVSSLGAFLGQLRGQMLGQGKEVESQMNGRAPIATPITVTAKPPAANSGANLPAGAAASVPVNEDDFLRRMVSPVPLNTPLNTAATSKTAIIPAGKSVVKKAAPKPAANSQLAQKVIDPKTLAQRVQMLEKQNRALQDELSRAVENSSAEDAEGTAIIEDKSMAGGLFTGGKPMPH
jgi:tetratricopeptide (TPR) repeat protein